MTRGTSLAAIACLALAACNTAIPDDTSTGVGFGDYEAYQQSRVEAMRVPDPGARGETVIPPRSQQVAAVPPAGTDPIATRAAAAIDNADRQQGQGPAQTPPRNTAAISDEQDFDAVAARETIESDAERRERMQEQMVIVAPTDVPQRPRSTGPNIIEYALATSHPVGQQVYRRSPFGRNRHEANCLSYQSDDLAQQAFLSMGGPERDRQSLDPDGDGYACDWNPEVYRNAARQG